jgi:MFS family permease
LRRLAPAARAPFRPLRVPNYRRYFAGQVVSLSGTWMQTIAEMWLVLRLTHSGVALGVTTALQFLPVLLAGAWGGLLADRFSKRRLLMASQAGLAVPSLAMWALTFSGAVEVWMIFALVFARGCVKAVDSPARQSFVHELAGPRQVAGAVALYSALSNSARLIGPALAGALIATVGVGPCFLLDGISFLAVIGALARIRECELHVGSDARAPRGAASCAMPCATRGPRPPCACRCCSSRWSGCWPTTSAPCCR